MNGDRVRVEAASQVTSPIRETPAGIGCGGELNHITFMIGGLIRILSHSAIGGGDSQRIFILSIVGRDRGIAVNGDRVRVEAADQIASPVREAPAGIGCGSELYNIAFMISGLIRILDHSAIGRSDG